MKQLPLKIIIATVYLLVFASYCSAVDTSILWGKWTNKDKKTKIVVEINNNEKYYIRIDSKKLTALRYKTCYTDLVPYPIATFVATDENDDRVEIQLVLGVDEIEKVPVLVGFYNIIAIDDPLKETVKENWHYIKLYKVSK